MDPLWNSLVVGGLQTDKEGQLKPFLGFLGMIGTSYEDAHVATGEHITLHQNILMVFERQTHGWLDAVSNFLVYSHTKVHARS